MISVSEYARYDGLGLAGLVQAGEVSPSELAATARKAVEQANPQLNAVLQVLDPQLPPPEASAGCFYGVPFLIKELVLHAKNIRCDMGSRLAQGFTAPHDTELMTRFRRAGFSLVGTTQTPELGYSPTAECTLFGPVHNPWDATRSAGGSSGGSAAAVAAGIVPIAHANDGGGSIRIPAACNGLVGLKPSRDRIPSGPDYADPLCGFGVEFALTKTVRDAAALLDCVAGADVGAPGRPVPPEARYQELIKRPMGCLRVAWSTTTNSGEKIAPECAQAVMSTVRLLESLGHTVVEAAPRYDWELFLWHTHVIWTSFVASSVKVLAEIAERNPEGGYLEAVTLACYQEGQSYKAIDLLEAMALGNMFSRQVGGFFEEYDVLITPALARLSAPLGEIDQNRAGMSAMDWTRQVFSYAPFTAIFNTTGQPAISLPLHWTDSGMPVGVQIAGRFGDEATLLSLARQLEETRPWIGRLNELSDRLLRDDGLRIASL